MSAIVSSFLKALTSLRILVNGRKVILDFPLPAIWTGVQFRDKFGWADLASIFACSSATVTGVFAKD